MIKKYIKIFIIKLINEDLLNNINLWRSYFKKYHSLNSLDKRVENYLKFNNGFFIELGANDGIKYSNTLFFERKRNWRGLLIEPIKKKYEYCLLNRSKKTIVANYACTKTNKNKVKLIYSNLMTTIANNKYIDLHQHLAAAKRHGYEDQKIFFSKGRTLNYILKKYSSPNVIDFLSLDTEGTELDILKGISFKKYKVKLILIESRNINQTITYLKKYNFFLKEKINIHDYIFLNNYFYDKKQN
jgi:hypothetical protein